MGTREHWNEVYLTKDSTEMSWYEEHLQLSLQLIKETGKNTSSQIIDIGSGTSTLVDDLMLRGYQNIDLLDISEAAINVAQQRLGPRANAVHWLKADVTEIQLPQSHYDIWHDRAVFHFLTHANDRQKYIETVQSSVKAGGNIILATFALDGPSVCSGLKTVRYDADSLQNELGDNFDLLNSVSESHQTPFGTEQKFIYCCFRKK